MKQGVTFLHELDEGDIEWLLGNASEQLSAADEVLIEAGETVDAIHIVLQGVLWVVLPEGGDQVAVLGPGDLVGDMSFLQEEPAGETVKAVEATTTLRLPHVMLHARCKDDPSFAARLYRSLGRLVSRRLRKANRRLAVGAETAGLTDGGHPAWDRVGEAIQEFKAGLHAANEAARKNDDAVPEEMTQELVERFQQFLPLLNDAFAATSENDRLSEEMGLRTQQEFLPYILLTETTERFYTKPRGYAGDFWTIELMYRNRPSGSRPIGAVVDRCFLDAPAARAVRNRRGLLADEIRRTVELRSNGPARVTSLACGPGREIFDVFGMLDDPSQLHATMLDIDAQALDLVGKTAGELGLGGSVTLARQNLIHLALGRTDAEIGEQDLVYSIGLIDYLDDRLVVRLMNYIHRILKPGGRVILGNFHPRNPTRRLMDHVLEWRLIHRTEEDMDRLYRMSSFGTPTSNIRFEEQGINLFAECVRA